MAKPARRPYAPRMASEQRRAQLLDAALAIIDRDGYRAVSVEAIAREAGVTRPVVYGVFPGLDGLLAALLDRQERRALGRIQAVLATPLDLADLDGWLVRTVRELAETVRDDPVTWRPIFLTRGTPAVVLERIDRDREEVRRRIERLVGLVLDAGGGDGRIDAAVASHALVGMGEHVARVLLEAPDALDVERLAATVAGLLGALRP